MLNSAASAIASRSPKTEAPRRPCSGMFAAVLKQKPGIAFLRDSPPWWIGAKSKGRRHRRSKPWIMKRRSCWISHRRWIFVVTHCSRRWIFVVTHCRYVLSVARRLPCLMVAPWQRRPATPKAPSSMSAACHIGLISDNSGGIGFGNRSRATLQRHRRPLRTRPSTRRHRRSDAIC